VYIIDLFLNTPTATASITAKGGFAVCHFNAGQFDSGTPGAAAFLPADKPAGSWLDIRSQNVRQIMRAVSRKIWAEGQHAFSGQAF
jgi:hypothetical protein